LWTNGYYRFQQIRSSDCDYVICFGISPLQAHCWIFPSEYVIKNATIQHKSEYWIQINPKDPYEWIKGYGGTLDDAYRVIKKIYQKQE
jgi:hypothetical protein